MERTTFHFVFDIFDEYSIRIVTNFLGTKCEFTKKKTINLWIKMIKLKMQRKKRKFWKIIRPHEYCLSKCLNGVVERIIFIIHIVTYLCAVLNFVYLYWMNRYSLVAGRWLVVRCFALVIEIWLIKYRWDQGEDLIHKIIILQ